jgi:hypothetical protein
MSVLGGIALLIGVNAALLVGHALYRHGVAKLISLFVMLLSSLIIVVTELREHAEYDAPPEVLLLMTGTAGFMLCHTFNWWLRRRHERKA